MSVMFTSANYNVMMEYLVLVLETLVELMSGGDVRDDHHCQLYGEVSGVDTGDDDCSDDGVVSVGDNGGVAGGGVCDDHHCQLYGGKSGIGVGDNKAVSGVDAGDDRCFDGEVSGVGDNGGTSGGDAGGDHCQLYCNDGVSGIGVGDN